MGGKRGVWVGVSSLAVLLLGPAAIGSGAAAQLSLDRWRTASECQRLGGAPGRAELDRIRCHRDEIGNVRFLNIRTREVAAVITSIRGRFEGEREELCIQTASWYRSDVPKRARDGACAAEWNAHRAAYVELRKATCNLGVARMGAMAGPIYDEIDRTTEAYDSCFEDALRQPGRPWSDAVRDYRISSKQSLRDLYLKLRDDYTRNQDRYEVFHQRHIEACNATLTALKREHPRLHSESEPTCDPGL